MLQALAERGERLTPYWNFQDFGACWRSCVQVGPTAKDVQSTQCFPHQHVKEIRPRSFSYHQLRRR